MAVSKKRPSRQSVPLGTRVTVCGKTVSGKLNLICLIPPGVPHETHVSIALDKDNHLAIILKKEGKGEEAEIHWLAGDPNHLE